METFAPGRATARRESVYFLNKWSSLSPSQLSDTPVSDVPKLKKVPEILGYTQRRKENNMDNKAMFFCELVCSIMKDIMEEALTIFQKNHRPSEDSQRNHSELLKTVERV